MTTTNGSPGPAAAPTGGAPAASPAAGGAPPAPGSTGSGAALTPGPSPEGRGEKKGPPLSKGARALQRVQARQAAGAAAAPKTDTTSEPAPGASPGAAATEGGTPPAGAAAPAAPAAGTSPSPDSPAADAGAAPPASTAEAPADWAADRRERFAAIKDPAGRALVLDFDRDFRDRHQDMQRGFTTAMTHLAQERERHQELFTLDQQFQSDPKAVLTELAKRANVEVWFEPPAPAGEIPDFKDPKEMAKWVAEQATRQARQLVEAERAKEREAQAGREAEAQRATAREALTAELAEALKAHPDFATHRPKVLSKLKAAPGLSVAEAYALVTLPALRQRVEALAAAERELKALKAEDAKRRAAATQPPAAAGASAGAVGTERPMSAAERAYRKVAAKKAAAGNPAAH